MKKKIGFFEEKEGVNSMARLQAFMFSSYAIVASAFVFINDDYAGGIATFTAISAIALGIKYIGKSQEIEKKKHKIDKVNSTNQTELSLK